MAEEPHGNGSVAAQLALFALRDDAIRDQLSAHGVNITELHTLLRTQFDDTDVIELQAPYAVHVVSGERDIATLLKLHTESKLSGMQVFEALCQCSAEHLARFVMQTFNSWTPPGKKKR